MKLRLYVRVKNPDHEVKNLDHTAKAGHTAKANSPAEAKNLVHTAKAKNLVHTAKVKNPDHTEVSL